MFLRNESESFKSPTFVFVKMLFWNFLSSQLSTLSSFIQFVLWCSKSFNLSSLWIIYFFEFIPTRLFCQVPLILFVLLFRLATYLVLSFSVYLYHYFCLSYIYLFCGQRNLVRLSVYLSICIIVSLYVLSSFFALL